MKFRVLTTALFLFSLFFTSVQAESDAEQIVRQSIDQVTSKLIAEKDQIEAHPDRVYALIQDLVVPHFDFPIISRLVLGKTAWADASEQQKESFIREFTTLLVRTYAKALQAYSDQEIVILTTDSDPNSNRVEVRTEVKNSESGNQTPMNFRMHISGGQWKVYDLVVDGISLVNSYRGEYKSIIRKDGFDGLIARMQERNSSS